MIKIRITGTHEELSNAMSITPNEYNLLSKSKPRQMPTDPLQWRIQIMTELKPAALDVPPSSAQAAPSGYDDQISMNPNILAPLRAKLMGGMLSESDRT